MAKDSVIISQKRTYLSRLCEAIVGLIFIIISIYSIIILPLSSDPTIFGILFILGIYLVYESYSQPKLILTNNKIVGFGILFIITGLLLLTANRDPHKTVDYFILMLWIMFIYSSYNLMIYFRFVTISFFITETYRYFKKEWFYHIRFYATIATILLFYPIVMWLFEGGGVSLGFSIMGIILSSIMWIMYSLNVFEKAIRRNSIARKTKTI